MGKSIIFEFSLMLKLVLLDVKYFKKKRVDRLICCDAWKQMKRISAEEGLVAIPYEKQFSIYSRLYQISKIYLFAPSSGKQSLSTI